MKKMPLGLTVGAMMLSTACLAQVSAPQPPQAWIEFRKQEAVKRAAFNQQIKADQEAFLSAHPEVKTYFAEMQAFNKERIAAWKAAHHRT